MTSRPATFLEQAYLDGYRDFANLGGIGLNVKEDAEALAAHYRQLGYEVITVPGSVVGECRQVDA